MTEDLPIGADERLRSLLDAAAGYPVIQRIGGRPVALGWATVELDREASELATALGIPPGHFVHTTPSSTLGARCLVARDGLEPGVAVVLLEPSTEGRLAASLARHGEGPVAVWLEVGDVPAAVTILLRAGVASSTPRPGPLGAERLLLDGPIHGPHRLVVKRPGTIRA